MRVPRIPISPVFVPFRSVSARMVSSTAGSASAVSSSSSLSAAYSGRISSPSSAAFGRTSSSSSFGRCSSLGSGRVFSSSKEATVSSRGTAAVNLLPVYLSDARSVTQYHPIDAPDGALQLSVAENQMLQDLLLPALHRFSSGTDDHDHDHDEGGGGTFRSDEIYYQPTHGRLDLRQAVAGYLHRLLDIPKGRGLDVEGLVCGAGCNAVLENLCFCLAEEGEAVLLPTPYYAAFEFDLVARAGLTIVPVNTVKHNHHNDDDNNTHKSVPKSAYYPNTASLDEAYQNARSTTGSPPKILLLSHPNNPLGISYPPHVVEECITWARENRVHLVSDEIYAGSVYRRTGVHDDGGDTFHSALKLASSDASTPDADDHAPPTEGLGIGPYVHFVYSLSKDFALSGLRLGVSYSENRHLRLPNQKLNDLCQISSQTQSTVARMLSDTTATDGEGEGDGGSWSTGTFLPENQDRIRTRCDRLQKCLRAVDIPYLHADSGMFVWMDLSRFLPTLDDHAGAHADTTVESDQSKDRRERTLYLELLNTFGLLFTPGRSMRNELPGFFRCVFTAASDAEFELALERIEKFVEAKRLE